MKKLIQLCLHQRNPSQRICLFLICVVLGLHCFGYSSEALSEETASNCGVRSVINLARYSGRALTAAQSATLAKRYPTEQVAMLDVKRAAESVGIKLSGWQMTAAELQTKGTPAIVSLPNHFTLVDYVGPKWVRVYESENPTLMPRAQFDRDYQGKALLPETLAGKGVLVIAEPVRDLGTLSINSAPQTIVVQLRNTGTKPVAIRSVQPSCSCTAVSQSPKVIKAGETVFLEFSVSVPQTGQFNADVSISTDAAYPVQWINIRGEVENDVLFDPTRLYTGTVEPGSETLRTVEIMDKDRKLARPLKVESSSASVSVESVQAHESGFKITLKVKPQMRGAIDEAIFIRNARGDGKDVKIPITGTVVGPLRSTPGTVFFGTVASAAGVMREVRVTRSDGKPFEIKLIDCPAGVAATFAAAAEGKSVWLVTLRIPAGTPAATIQGEIDIRSGDGPNHSVAIPVFAVVQ